ncbi:hypothetical protein D3C85_1538550 [compost metagenome]
MTLTQGTHLAEQDAGRGQRQPLLQLLHLASQQIVPCVQQVHCAARQGETTISQAFVDRLQLVGQITDGPHASHAGAALEGMQVALQRGQRRACLRFGQPALEGFGGTVENVASLFEEDLDHLFIEIFLVDRR